MVIFRENDADSTMVRKGLFLRKIRKGQDNSMYPDLLKIVYTKNCVSSPISTESFLREKPLLPTAERLFRFDIIILLLKPI